MELQNIIISHMPGKRKKTPSGWTTINCPMCTTNGQSRPDTRSRGGFRFVDGMVYHLLREMRNDTVQSPPLWSVHLENHTLMVIDVQ